MIRPEVWKYSSANTFHVDHSVISIYAIGFMGKVIFGRRLSLLAANYR